MGPVVALVAPAAVGGAEEPGIGKSEGAVSTEAAVEAAVAAGSRRTRNTVAAAASRPSPVVADGYQRKLAVGRGADGDAPSTGGGRQICRVPRRANFELPAAKTRMSGCGGRRWR